MLTKGNTFSKTYALICHTPMLAGVSVPGAVPEPSGRGFGNTPTDVERLTLGEAAVAVGGTYSCAVTTNGGLKCWGYNRYGQLGDGTNTHRNTPVDVVGFISE